jgi:hypothetical protein
MLLKRPLLAAILVFVIGLALLPKGMLRVLSHPDDYPCETLASAIVPAGPVVFTAAHVSAWLSSAGSQRLVLVNQQTGQQRLLSRLPVLRHRHFDLTGYLNPNASYALQLRDTAKPVVEEFSIRQCRSLTFFPPLHWLCAGAFVLYMVAWALGGRRFTTRHWIALVTLVGFCLRWNGLGAAFGAPLEGDATGYHQLASQFSWQQPLSTGYREPLYIWLLAAIQSLLGANEFYVQLLSTLLSTAIVPLTMLLILELCGDRLAACAGGLLVAIGDFCVFNATRGERSELFVFLLMAYFWLLLRSPKSFRSEIGLGIVGGLVGLTWLVGLVSVLIAYPYRWWREKLSRWQAVAFLLALAAVVFPHLFEQWRASGDPFHALNVHVNFYKNAAETGVPSYDGAKISWLSYLLSGHLSALVSHTVRGYFDLLLNPMDAANRAFLGFHPTQAWSLALFPLLLIGIVTEIWKARYGIFWLLWATLNVMPGFLAEIRDPRLFLQVEPFFALFVGCGLTALASLVKKRFR